MESSHDIVLSYGDIVLRESDVMLLEGPHWLNDTVMSFFFEYLSNDVFKKHQSKFLFVGPEVTHCLKAAKQSELPIFLDPLDAKEKELVFLALNDHKMYGQSGGTHWSLLVFCRADGKMYHLDSMKGCNYRQAMKLTGKLLEYLSPTGTGDFEEMDGCQQNNGYDCGIFVLCYAEFLPHQFLTKKTLRKCQSLDISVTLSMRQEILNLVFNLKNAT